MRSKLTKVRAKGETSPPCPQIWSIVANVTLKPLYRPQDLDDRQWQKHLSKNLPSTSKVWLESMDFMGSDWTWHNFALVHGYYRNLPQKLHMTRLSLIWLSNWRVQLTNDRVLVNIMTRHNSLTPRSDSFWGQIRPDLNRDDLLEWAGKNEAKFQAEQAVLKIIEYQKVQMN